MEICGCLTISVRHKQDVSHHKLIFLIKFDLKIKGNQFYLLNHMCAAYETKMASSWFALACMRALCRSRIKTGQCPIVACICLTASTTTIFPSAGVALLGTFASQRKFHYETSSRRDVKSQTQIMQNDKC